MDTFTIEYASTMLRAAIDSGAIKLTGPTSSASPAAAKEAAQIDAAYLRMLFTELTRGANPRSQTP